MPRPYGLMFGPSLRNSFNSRSLNGVADDLDQDTYYWNRNYKGMGDLPDAGTLMLIAAAALVILPHILKPSRG